MTVHRVIMLICLLIAGMIPGVLAHPPSDMKLLYNDQTQTLQVVITHPVSGASDHFIKSVSVSADGKDILTQTYSSQKGDTVTYSYPLSIPDGRAIQVTAKCSIFGSLTKGLDQGGVTPKTSTPGFISTEAGVALCIGAGLILIRSRG